MIERVLCKNETNVAVAPKEPLYLSPIEQLDLMKEYTNTHKKYTNGDKLIREIECLKVLFPKVFRPMYEDDLILGRFDPLLVGFGSVTSVGGPGHYCRLEREREKRSSNKYNKENGIRRKEGNEERRSE